MSYATLYPDLWAQILGALDPGTDLYAAVLAIAPVHWDAHLGDTAIGDERDLARIARDFPAWHLPSRRVPPTPQH